jgi:hypothetical protein
MTVKIEKVAAHKSKQHTRYKKLDGTPVGGVTSVLGVLSKPALVPWANRLGLQGVEVNKYIDVLAEVGTLAHYLTICHLTKTIDVLEDIGDFKSDVWGTNVNRVMFNLAEKAPEVNEYSPNQVASSLNCLRKYLNWESKHDVKPIDAEFGLVSEKWGFGGTIDLFAFIDGKLECVDFKTGKAIYDTHFYQTAAYRRLIDESHYGQDIGKVDQCRILQIGRDEQEGFGEKILVNTTREWETFRHALAIYNLKKSERVKSQRRKK